MNNIELLKTLRPLTQEERQTAQAAARAAVMRDAGDRPERRQFQRELGSLFTLLDVLALAVFIPALLVSSLHIISHMGTLAVQSYASLSRYEAGTVIGRDLYTAAHQWLLIPLAEASMLLFLVMFAMAANTWRKWVYLALAAAAVLFVAVANIQSGIGAIESILAPVFTIGVGLHLENLIVRSLKRRDDITSRYLKALHDWETATAKPDHHPKYVQMYANALKDAIYKANSRREAAKSVTIAEWRLLVKREIAADQWYEDVTLPTEPPRPLPETVNSDSGNIPRVWGDHASILPMPTSNGHIAIENVTK